MYFNPLCIVLALTSTPTASSSRMTDQCQVVCRINKLRSSRNNAIHLRHDTTRSSRPPVTPTHHRLPPDSPPRISQSRLVTHRFPIRRAGWGQYLSRKSRSPSSPHARDNNDRDSRRELEFFAWVCAYVDHGKEGGRKNTAEEECMENAAKEEGTEKEAYVRALMKGVMECKRERAGLATIEEGYEDQMISEGA
ncbi:hypothetical protein BKA63DRAFT_497788 [Paraphoma chrysanthemicola]|nr:hypothetical protein BKA63DRAFT_497788 [Paraphoma chrysanthemicola]